MLVLVAQDQLGQLAGAVALDRVQRALAHVGEVGERLLAVEQREVAADLARRLEGVVHGGQLRRQQGRVAEAVDQPQVLVGGDVGEVPHQRAHQRRVRGLDVGVGEPRDQGEGPLAGFGEELGGVDLARRDHRQEPYRPAVTGVVGAAPRGGAQRRARRQTSTTSRTEAVRHEIRESSGRTISSNRPESSCSSSVTSA